MFFNMNVLDLYSFDVKSSKILESVQIFKFNFCNFGVCTTVHVYNSSYFIKYYDVCFAYHSDNSHCRRCTYKRTSCFIIEKNHHNKTFTSFFLAWCTIISNYTDQHLQFHKWNTQRVCWIIWSIFIYLCCLIVDLGIKFKFDAKFLNF